MKRIFMALLLLSSISFALANLSACGTINVADTYELNTSLVSAGNCIRITAADVVIDGMGYSISGNGLGSAINIEALRANITNITINGYQKAINVTSANGRVFNSTITNSTYGIYQTSNLLQIQNNSITNISNASIRFQNTGGTVQHYITNNTLTCSATSVIEGCLHFEMANSYYNVTKNNITHTSSTGNILVLSGAVDNLVIYDNYLSNSNVLSVTTGTNVSYNTTKQAGTNIINGSNLGGNYWANTQVYDTDNDSISNGAFRTIGPFYDYLPLTNLLGGYFISPSPANESILASNIVDVAFNFSLINMTSCLVDVDGNNYTGIMSADNLSCAYQFSISPFTHHAIIGWSNVSNTWYRTNITLDICHLGCAVGSSYNPPPEAPPSGGGGGAVIVSPSSVATAIISASGGNIETMPINCTPFFSTKVKFIGATTADKLACEYKGVMGLYVKRAGNFVNFAMIFLLFFVYMTYSMENKKTTSFYVFGGLSIVTLVLGYDFLTFSATALLLALSGGRLT